MLEYYKSLNLHFVRICPTCLKVLARRLEIEELDMDGEKAARPEFAYPYCYADHEVASLCAHVEEEHPLEWRYSLHNVLVQQSILDVQKSSRVFGMSWGRKLILILKPRDRKKSFSHLLLLNPD